MALASALAESPRTILRSAIDNLRQVSGGGFDPVRPRRDSPPSHRSKLSRRIRMEALDIFIRSYGYPAFFGGGGIRPRVMSATRVSMFTSRKNPSVAF